jgi:CubicO group peptidase (beta-lactamase class C family)
MAMHEVASKLVSIAVLMCLLPMGRTALAQEDAQSARQTRGLAIEALISGSGDESLQRFIDENLSAEFQQSLSRDNLLDLLRQIRQCCAVAGGIEGEALGPHTVRLTFHTGQGSHAVQFQIQPSPPFKIVDLTLKEAEPPGASRGSGEPISWDTLAQRLKDEEKAGFSGAVSVVRDGEIVVNRGYGMANRERGIPNTTETIFAIGSIPIDFTKAAILKLEDMGRLRTSDPITTYVLDIPDDKRSMTIDHLMRGRSGLPNFHHIPGQDEDPDLTWIDRDTAVKRILAKELIFPPGEGEAHSHSAWVLLAAIVEMVSEQSYGEFLQSQLFAPAGMDRTGLYQDSRRFNEDDIAVGYGSNSVGEINSPAYWGDTSWLVMGSGGMVSKPGDLFKWVEAIRAGKILSPAATEKFWSDGPLAGGNDRGFFCLYTEGPGTMVFLCSNSHASMNDPAKQLARDLARLVMAD